MQKKPLVVNKLCCQWYWCTEIFSRFSRMLILTKLVVSEIQCSHNDEQKSRIQATMKLQKATYQNVKRSTTGNAQSSNIIYIKIFATNKKFYCFILTTYVWIYHCLGCVVIQLTWWDCSRMIRNGHANFKLSDGFKFIRSNIIPPRTIWIHTFPSRMVCFLSTFSTAVESVLLSSMIK